MMTTMMFQLLAASLMCALLVSLLMRQRARDLSRRL